MSRMKMLKCDACGQMKVHPTFGRCLACDGKGNPDVPPTQMDRGASLRDDRPGGPSGEANTPVVPEVRQRTADNRAPNGADRAKYNAYQREYKRRRRERILTSESEASNG